MLYITEAQAKTAITIPSSLSVIRTAYLTCNTGGISPGPRMVHALDPTGNTGQWLTATYPSAPTGSIFGTKFSSVFRSNPNKGLPATISTISLYSGTTGALLATVEANALTAIKTAGSAAIATDLLARKDARRLTIIGSGLQAFDQVLAIREVRAIKTVLVFDLSRERAEKFAEHLRAVADFDAVVEIASDADAAVREADIVCTCTTSSRPVFKGASLRPGTHVNAIGSFAPDMQEIDENTVVRAERIVTEHVDGLWAAAGDILAPFDKGVIDKSKVDGSVGDVLAGKVAGRTDAEQVTLYESVGSAALDLAIAVEVYRLVSKSAQEEAKI